MRGFREQNERREVENKKDDTCVSLDLNADMDMEW